jgi:hypothetical protein
MELDSPYIVLIQEGKKTKNCRYEDGYGGIKQYDQQIP